MNAQPSSPVPAPRIEAVPGTLDERIVLAEGRLIAREQGLRLRWQGLVQGLQRATAPRRLVLPALALSVVLAAAWWLRRRGGVRSGASGAGVSAAAAYRLGARAAPRWSGLPWVRGTALIWPLLPARWRARISPATASLMVAFALPLAAQIFKPRQPRPDGSTD